MVKLVLPILSLLAGCRNEARRRPRSVMLLSEEQRRKGDMLTEQRARQLNRQRRFSVALGNPGVIWAFTLTKSLQLEDI